MVGSGSTMNPMSSPAAAIDARVSPFPSLAGYSLEATMPNEAEIDRLAGRVAPGTEVYLSTPPYRPDEARLAAAVALARAGLVPVPHIAARNVSGQAALEDFVKRLAGEAGVDRLLVIGGDLDTPRGPFAAAGEIIDRVPLAEIGIREIGVAGYPEGHPVIPSDALPAILDTKLAAARARGLAVHIVSQFCFDAPAIVEWIRCTRAAHPDIPIKVGVAGPASLGALLKYAVRCGVKAPMEGLGRKLAMARKLLGPVAPDGLLAEVEAGLAALPIGAPQGAPVSAHFFSFGGLDRTADWVAGSGIGPAR